MKHSSRWLSLLLVFFFSSTALAAENWEEKPLDGVSVEALEIYRNPRSSAFDFGLGLWPINPYYNGLSVNLAYSWIFNKTFSWEVLNGHYVWTVDKGLTSELAQDYAVNPRSIERINYVVSSNLKYVLAYGKFVFFKKHIRYFRAHAIAGPAVAVTNKRTAIGADVGLSFETYVNNYFSWKMELRNTIVTVGSTTNNLVISFGTSYAF